MIMMMIIIILDVVTQSQKRCLGSFTQSQRGIYIYIHLIGGRYVAPTAEKK